MTEIVDNTMNLSNTISKHIAEDIIGKLEEEIKTNKIRNEKEICKEIKTSIKKNHK